MIKLIYFDFLQNELCIVTSAEKSDFKDQTIAILYFTF